MMSINKQKIALKQIKQIEVSEYFLLDYVLAGGNVISVVSTFTTGTYNYGNNGIIFNSIECSFIILPVLYQV